MKKLPIGAAVIWRELDPAFVPGDEERWIEHDAIVRGHGRDAAGIYTEIEVADGRVLEVHRDALREAAPPICPHPEHRLGTHGRLRKHQRVCLQCGATVVVGRRR